MKHLHPDRTFVISDTHFGHKNILLYMPSRQKWATTVEEMDTKLIAAWNDAVSPTDTVLHMGDFALTPATQLARYFQVLNGRKIIIKGNHDRITNGKLAGFGCDVFGFLVFMSQNRKLVAIHQPEKLKQVITKDHDSFSFMLHGHAHGSYPSVLCKDQTGIYGVDVGVDSLTELRGDSVPSPISLRKIMLYFDKCGSQSAPSTAIP